MNNQNQEQMKFVYQALLNGWQVKYMGDETFEFKKRRNKFTQNIMLNQDIQRVLCDIDTNVTGRGRKKERSQSPITVEKKKEKDKEKKLLSKSKDKKIISHS